MELNELAERAATRLEELGLLEAAIDGRVAPVADPRTVRYHGSLGLVDRPLGYERHRARYGERHVLQLVAIKARQRHHVPLAEVQSRLYARTDVELGALIQSLARPRGRPSSQGGPRVVRRREDRRGQSSSRSRRAPGGCA